MDTFKDFFEEMRNFFGDLNPKTFDDLNSDYFKNNGYYYSSNKEWKGNDVVLDKEEEWKNGECLKNKCVHKQHIEQPNCKCVSKNDCHCEETKRGECCHSDCDCTNCATNKERISVLSDIVKDLKKSVAKLKQENDNLKHEKSELIREYSKLTEKMGKIKDIL